MLFTGMKTILVCKFIDSVIYEINVETLWFWLWIYKERPWVWKVEVWIKFQFFADFMTLNKSVRSLDFCFFTCKQDHRIWSLWCLFTSFSWVNLRTFLESTFGVYHLLIMLSTGIPSLFVKVSFSVSGWHHVLCMCLSAWEKARLKYIFLKKQ